MRKIILLAVLCPVFSMAFGQPTTNPFPKTITVTGTAEMEVVPDQIYVQIVLREYQKRGEDKKELDMIKNDFMSAYKAAGLPDSVISIVSYTGYNNYYWLRKKKKSPDLFAGITYQVKFSNSRDMDALVDKLDDEATQSFTIVSTDHSQIVDFRRQLRIDAIKAAKNKAIYLTEAINEKVAGAITVKEPETSTVNYANGITGKVSGLNVVSPSYYKSDGLKSFDIDFKSFKLRYEVTVVFAIQ